MQIDPDLVKDVGIIPWFLMVIVAGGVSALTFFLRRMVQAMDRMASAQEATPARVDELRTLLIERFDRIEPKLDQAVNLASEHVRIARMWERTEAPGRSVRHDPPPG